MSSKPKILLTNSIHPASQRKLDKFYDVIVAPDTKVETLKMLIKDCDGLIVRCQLPEDIFEGADNLKVVVRHGVGLDFIPVAAATEKKIPVANLPGSNTRAVVEYCLAVIFYFSYAKVTITLIPNQERLSNNMINLPEIDKIAYALDFEKLRL